MSRSDGGVTNAVYPMTHSAMQFAEQFFDVLYAVHDYSPANLMTPHEGIVTFVAEGLKGGSRKEILIDWVHGKFVAREADLQ